MEAAKRWCSWVTRAISRREPDRGDEMGVDAAHGGPAGTRRVDAGEEEGERALAGAARSDDGHPGAGGRRQVDAPQDVMSLVVGVVQVPGLHLSPTGSSGVVGAGSTSWTPRTRDNEAEATCTSSIQASRVSTGPMSCWA